MVDAKKQQKSHFSAWFTKKPISKISIKIITSVD